MYTAERQTMETHCCRRKRRRECEVMVWEMVNVWRVFIGEICEDFGS